MALDGAVAMVTASARVMVLLGPEGAVLIPIHDAGVGGLVDVILGPVAVNVREEVFALVGASKKRTAMVANSARGDVPPRASRCRPG